MFARSMFVCLIVTALVGVQPAPAETAPPVPGFTYAACPFAVDSSLTAGKDIRCGYLTVPENRASATSRTIKIAVAIIKSVAERPALDPEIFLMGGPGGRSLQTIGSALTAEGRMRIAPDRDFVLVDQRGTGYSQPNLGCTEMKSLSPPPASGSKPPTLAQEEAVQLQAARQCRARLVKLGVDLGAYNSIENAEDIADLRVALGYNEVNLYGSSYGSRLALTVMRVRPQGIRSVVLDAVLPPTVNLLADAPRAAAHIFGMVFDDCASTPACKQRYPKLGATFRKTVTALDRKSVKLTVRVDALHTTKLWLTGETFLQVVFNALYNSSQISAVREAVSEAGRGDYRGLSILAGAIAGDSISSVGMFYSVTCSEDAPGPSQATLSAAAKSLPAALRADFSALWLRSLHACRVWNVPPVDPAQRQPVTSSISTLVMDGAYDPITPPAYAVEVAKTLPHSFTFVYPGMGHGTRYSAECPYSMALAFERDPATEPSDTCISTMPQP